MIFYATWETSCRVHYGKTRTAYTVKTFCGLKKYLDTNLLKISEDPLPGKSCDRCWELYRKGKR